MATHIHGLGTDQTHRYTTAQPPVTVLCLTKVASFCLKLYKAATSNLCSSQLSLFIMMVSVLCGPLRVKGLMYTCIHITTISK